MLIDRSFTIEEKERIANAFVYESVCGVIIEQYQYSAKKSAWFKVPMDPYPISNLPEEVLESHTYFSMVDDLFDKTQNGVYLTADEDSVNKNTLFLTSDGEEDIPYYIYVMGRSYPAHTRGINRIADAMEDAVDEICSMSTEELLSELDSAEPGPLYKLEDFTQFMVKDDIYMHLRKINIDAEEIFFFSTLIPEPDVPHSVARTHVRPMLYTSNIASGSDTILYGVFPAVADIGNPDTVYAELSELPKNQYIIVSYGKLKSLADKADPWDIVEQSQPITDPDLMYKILNNGYTQATFTIRRTR